MILGEYHRLLDERHRLTIPVEMIQRLDADIQELLLVKEQPGALSLWNAQQWQPRWNQDLELIERKLQAGRFVDRLGDAQ